MINISGNIGELYVGSTPIDKAYIGSQLVWEKGSSLPYDAQVEWLATDGTAYIDIGLKPTNTTTMEIVMDIPALSQNTWFWGCRASSSSRQYALYKESSKWSWRFGSKNASSTTGISQDRYTFDNHTSAGAYQLYIKHSGSTATLSAADNSFTCNYNFVIFGLNAAGSISASSMQDGLKCVSAKFWSGTTLVRDYIPVRKNGVGYLYDKVNNVLYGNARSTGAFTYGNDVT